MKFIVAILALACGTSTIFAQENGYAWIDSPGSFMDLVYDGKKVVRYVYETMDPENREATYKPFHHVYDAAGEDFITKGPGGKFTHHRGIFFGFSKCLFTAPSGEDVSIDSWHCKRGYQTHEAVLESKAEKDAAMHKVLINWRMDDGFVFLREERQLSFSPLENGLVVDFHSKLNTELEKVTLDGDPQHAGFQFRASNEVHDTTFADTYYIRPKTGKNEPGKFINWSKNDDDLSVTNLPWKAMSFVVGGERYTVLYLDHPSNPKPARYSERNYARFGSYFVAPVTPDAPLEVNYRLRIIKGELTMEDCEQFHNEWLEAVPPSN